MSDTLEIRKGFIYPLILFLVWTLPADAFSVPTIFWTSDHCQINVASADGSSSYTMINSMCRPIELDALPREVILLSY